MVRFDSPSASPKNNRNGALTPKSGMVIDGGGGGGGGGGRDTFFGDASKDETRTSKSKSMGLTVIKDLPNGIEDSVERLFRTVRTF